MLRAVGSFCDVRGWFRDTSAVGLFTQYWIARRQAVPFNSKTETRRQRKILTYLLRDIQRPLNASHQGHQRTFQRCISTGPHGLANLGSLRMEF
jgi:hypothetical protein